MYDETCISPMHKTCSPSSQLILASQQRHLSEIERLELMIAETKNSIEKYKGQGVSTDTQRKKVLRGLEEQLFITEVRLVESKLVPVPIPARIPGQGF